VIAVLHQVTAVDVRGDGALTRLWVDRHLEELEPFVGRDRRLRLASARLGHELHEALEGERYTASRIHGDYWVGNILLASPGPRPGGIAGIVDWDASGPRELPLHDLLHLLMYSRRLLTGRELGGIVSEQLRRGEWPVEERVLFDRSANASLSARHAVLLYWLRHVAMHTRQQSEPAGWRFKLWHRRNVHRVLELL
jgi:aminoglycoside phosphotransferase (APT) family kinase protein